MKDSLYFPHDSNASNDPKILALRGVYGSAGYGNYWMIVELLREQEGYRLKLKKYGIDALSIRLGYDRNTTEQFINDCCDTFELLQTDGDFLWCESLSKRMQPLEEKREKARDSIMQRWKNKGDIRTKYGRNTDVIRTNNERNTSKVKESKVKESKVRGEGDEKPSQNPPPQKPQEPNSTLPIQAQIFISSGGEFQPGRLPSGELKRDEAVKQIREVVIDDPASLGLWASVVKAYCTSYSARGLPGMLDYYRKGQIPGEGGNGSRASPQKPKQSGLQEHLNELREEMQNGERPGKIIDIDMDDSGI